MSFHDLLYCLDLAGTFAFAISGVLRGIEKQMDIFGMLVLAVATASGGGTLRSILTGEYPVPFLEHPAYLVTCVLATAIVFYFRNRFARWKKALLVFDAIGLGTFLGLGTTVAIDHHISYWAAVMLGMVTAAFGGIIRDVLCSEVPLIFRRELYATCCIAGGLIYVALLQLQASQTVIISVAIVSTIALRLLSLKYNWSLPK